MADDPLKQSRLKVEWADQKIRDLNAAWANFLVNGGPCQFRAEADPKTGYVVFRMRRIQALPDELSLIAGDVLNNLRSSLDYLVRSLVLANGNTPARKCGFPIFLDSQKYKSMKAGMIQGVTGSAETRIDSLQPFNTGPGASHPLWILQELNNTDKHKLLIALAGSGGWRGMGFAGGKPGQECSATFGVKVGVPIEEGAEVLVLQDVTLGVHMQPKFSVQIMLPQIGTTPSQPAIRTLHQLSGVVTRTLDAFVVDFP